MKVDQCQHCTVRGDLDACKVTLCNQHESWYAVTMQAKIADLESAEEGAKIAFGDVVDQKHALTKRCESLEASIAAMRDIISTQAVRIAALEADAARMDWIQKNLLCADWEYPQGEKKTQPVICISWPASVGISGNLRSSIDDAMKGGA